MSNEAPANQVMCLVCGFNWNSADPGHEPCPGCGDIPPGGWTARTIAEFEAHLTECHAEGLRAARMGLTPFACPYREGSMEEHSWVDGWREGVGLPPG